MNRSTPGPWRECGHDRIGGCSCGYIWSVTADAPIAQTISGTWGDEYPEVRLVPIEDGGFRVEAYMVRIDYGFIPQMDAIANARLIAAVPDFVAGVEQMLVYEDAGGDGWWKGWNMLKAAYANSR